MQALYELETQSTAFDPSDGLIAYYPFNGNANDLTGNSHHGTVNGVTCPQSTRRGKRTYSFDGLNDYIEVLINRS